MPPSIMSLLTPDMSYRLATEQCADDKTDTQCDHARLNRVGADLAGHRILCICQFITSGMNEIANCAASIFCCAVQIILYIVGNGACVVTEILCRAFEVLHVVFFSCRKHVKAPYFVVEMLT